VANDGQVWGRWWDGSNWQPWFPLPHTGARFPVGAQLAVHSRHSDHMELWCIDQDATLRGNWWNHGFQSNWYSLPTPPSNGPSRLRAGGGTAVLGRNDDHMELWSVATDGRMNGIWWDGTWRPWYNLSGPTFPAGAPVTALSRHSDHMEVYCITGASGGGFAADRLVGVFWDGNWQPYHQIDALPMSRNSPLAALSRAENHLELWCVGSAGSAPDDMGVQGVWFDGGNWRGFYRVI
jgi:hypothetical protein